ncbi:MAG: hypothetical protein K940chlam9_01249 [Chlamydiae bacterium]|nr:hypothetical protein [Chlamydiota bacterium]
MKEKSRLTLDMSPDEHMYLKMASARLGVTMRELILAAVFTQLEEIDSLADNPQPSDCKKLQENKKPPICSSTGWRLSHSLLSPRFYFACTNCR